MATVREAAEALVAFARKMQPDESRWDQHGLALARALEATDDTPPNTVKVRIAVAVAYAVPSDPSEGVHVSAFAVDNRSDDDYYAMQVAKSDFKDRLTGECFLEAYVPLPESSTIQAEVKP